MSDEYSRYTAQFHELTVKNFEAVISAGISAIRLFAGINGGALLAMLAFAGGAAGKKEPILASMEPLVSAMTYFGYGIVMAAVAAGGMYFAQFFYGMANSSMKLSREHPYVLETKSSKLRHKFGVAAHVATVVACFASFIFFVVGVISVISIVRGIKL